MIQTISTGFSPAFKRLFNHSTTSKRFNNPVGATTLSSALLLMALVFPAIGADLPKAEGKILIEVNGNISQSNNESGVAIDMAMIEALPVTTFSTATPWTEGNTQWTGVRLNVFLDYIGAGSHELHVKALDGYEVDFKKVDLEKYPVIIAYKKNGEYMSVRELGPLWIMFPFADYPELDIQFNRSMSVWQVREMEVL